MKKEKTAYDELIKLFKICVRHYVKASGCTTEEAKEIIVPTVLVAVDKVLRDSIK